MPPAEAGALAGDRGIGFPAFATGVEGDYARAAATARGPAARSRGRSICLAPTPKRPLALKDLREALERTQPSVATTGRHGDVDP